MNIELTNLEYRRLLDMVYIGNWILNSIRGNDRFYDYDVVESKIFSHCHENKMDALVTRIGGITFLRINLSKAAYTRLSQIMKHQFSLVFLQKKWH